MNILFELKERLRYILVAGVKLIDEDFRLKKITEELVPLSQKNQIFNKIYVDLKTLFEAEKEQRTAIILNIVALVDAVIYTQAQTDIETNDAQPLEVDNVFESVEQARYSELEPLIKALTTKGSGRYEILRDALYKRENSDIFKNYKIINALINDLDDSYSEMATLVFNIIDAIGNQKIMYNNYYVYYDYLNESFNPPKFDKKQIVKLLKRDFDPKGKKLMEKRLELIGKIAQADENKFYLSVLENANSKIRICAISCLGYDSKNSEILKEIITKKKGVEKETAYNSLAKIDYEKNRDFWNEQLEKNKDVISYLRDCTDEKLSDIAADILYEKFKTAKLDWQFSYKLREFEFKTSKKMFDVYNKILEECEQSEKDTSSVQTAISNNIFCVLHFNPKIVIGYLKNIAQKNDYKNVKRDTYGMLRNCLFADLLTLPSQQVYDEWLKPKKTKDIVGALTCVNLYILDDKYVVSLYGVQRELFEPLCFDFLIALAEYGFLEKVYDLLKIRSAKEKLEIVKYTKKCFENTVKTRGIFDIQNCMYECIKIFYEAQTKEYEGLFADFARLYFDDNIEKNGYHFVPSIVFTFWNRLKRFLPADIIFQEIEKILDVCEENNIEKTPYENSIVECKRFLLGS